MTSAKDPLNGPRTRQKNDFEDICDSNTDDNYDIHYYYSRKNNNHDNNNDDNNHNNDNNNNI